MDVEGAEYFLLDPELVPNLANCYILAEYHNHIIENISDILESRFKKTHIIRKINQRKRTSSEFPINLNNLYLKLFKKYIINTMNEFRHDENGWLKMVPEIYDI